MNSNAFRFVRHDIEYVNSLRGKNTVMKTLVILAERLDNAAQGVLAQLLEPCLEGDLWADASRVSFLGGRCFELLISASKTASDNNSTFAIMTPSDEFNACLQSLGHSTEGLENVGVSS